MRTLAANGRFARFTASWRMLRIVLINVQHSTGEDSKVEQQESGDRGSPSSSKADAGKLRIDEGHFSSISPESQAPANSGRSRIVQDDGLSVSITSNSGH